MGQGTRYFPEIPVDEGVVMVRARGNISLQDAEALTSKVEQIVMSVEGIESTVTQINPNLGYASNSGDDRVPVDVVGQIYFSLNDYKVRDLNSFELLDLLRENQASRASLWRSGKPNRGRRSARMCSCKCARRLCRP